MAVNGKLGNTHINEVLHTYSAYTAAHTSDRGGESRIHYTMIDI